MPNPGELQLVGMGAKQAAKYSRTVFRDLISQLKDRQAIPKGANPYTDYTPRVIKNVGEKVRKNVSLLDETPESNRYTIAEDMIKKSGLDRFGSLSKLSSSSSADPTSFVSDAVRTGMIDGQKLSSQQRNELAQRLSLVRMIQKGDVPANNTFAEDVLNRSPIDIKDYGYLNRPINALYSREFKDNPIADKANSIGRKNLSARDRDTIDTIKDNVYANSPDQRRYYSMYPELPLTSTFNLDDAYNKTIGFLRTRGWNTGSLTPAGRVNSKVTDALAPDIIFNTIIKKYNITDPSVAETIKTLLPEWTGSAEELVAMARMI